MADWVGGGDWGWWHRVWLVAWSAWSVVGGMDRALGSMGGATPPPPAASLTNQKTRNAMQIMTTNSEYEVFAFLLQTFVRN